MDSIENHTTKFTKGVQNVAAQSQYLQKFSNNMCWFLQKSNPILSLLLHLIIFYRAYSCLRTHVSANSPDTPFQPWLVHKMTAGKRFWDSGVSKER